MQVVESTGNVCVAVVVPSGTYTRFVSFELSIEGLFVPTKSTYARNSSSSPAWNRNEAIRRAEKEITHFWLIDDDHMFDAGILMQLLNHKLEVVCCLTQLARPPFHPVLFSSEVFKDGRIKWVSIPWTDLDGKRGLYGPIWAAGGAGILVARTLTDRMPDPWFALGQYVKDECNEDMYFYDQVRKAGVPIYIDLSARLGHSAPCTVFAEQDEHGLWYIVLLWDNGQTIKLGLSRSNKQQSKLIPVM